MAHFVARMLIGHHTDEGARNAPGSGLHCELPHNARPSLPRHCVIAADSRPILSCQQVQRLEEVFQLLDQQLKSKKCPGIDEILQEGREIMEEFKGRPALDAGLLAGAQAHALRHVDCLVAETGPYRCRSRATALRHSASHGVLLIDLS
jgi:Domain of unknown function (DUF892)